MKIKRANMHLNRKILKKSKLKMILKPHKKTNHRMKIKKLKKRRLQVPLSLAKMRNLKTKNPKKVKNLNIQSQKR